VRIKNPMIASWNLNFVHFGRMFREWTLNQVIEPQVYAVKAAIQLHATVFELIRIYSYRTDGNDGIVFALFLNVSTVRKDRREEFPLKNVGIGPRSGSRSCDPDSASSRRELATGFSRLPVGGVRLAVNCVEKRRWRRRHLFVPARRKRAVPREVCRS